MQSGQGERSKSGPKRRNRHYSYNESVDETPTLIEDEPVDIEGAVPAEENESVEEVEKEDAPPAPPFDTDPSRDEPHE